MASYLGGGVPYGVGVPLILGARSEVTRENPSTKLALVSLVMQAGQTTLLKMLANLPSKSNNLKSVACGGVDSQMP